jgi:hypothetical protein
LLLKELLDGLYRDGLFPSLDMLEKRLQALPNGLSTNVTTKDLIQVARMNPVDFEIEEDKAHSTTNTYGPVLLGRPRPSPPAVFSIRLAKTPVWFQGFVDTASGEDPYSSALWKSFELYLENLARLVRSKISCKAASNPRNGETTSIDDTEGPHAFKGSTSEVASELKRRRLPFFDGMRFGDIQHIVHLAFEKRKLLVRVGNSTTVPAAAFSQSSSVAGRPPSAKNVVRSRRELCEILDSLLGRCEEGVELSRLKEKILETTNLRLEERLFECLKLLDVLRLPEVAQVCRLEKQEGRNVYRIFSRKIMCENATFDVDAVLQLPCPPSQEQLVPGYQQAVFPPCWPSQHVFAAGPQKKNESQNLAYIPAPPGLDAPEKMIEVYFSWKGNQNLVLRDGEPAYIPLRVA